MTEAPPRKKKRGSETARDMLLSLAVVFLVVIPLWFFGQSSPGDEQEIRPVDPSGALSAFAEDTGAPVPTAPEGWVVNVAKYDGSVIRVGYVIDEEAYTEFSGGSGPAFLEAAAGKGTANGTVDVGGVTWERHVTADGHESLVRTDGRTTLVIGGIRESVSEEQLKELAATLR